VDPFVATIIKQGAVLAFGIAAAAFVIFFMVRMSALQHAMSNNVYPPGLQG
jgi:hypothetical protein